MAAPVEFPPAATSAEITRAYLDDPLPAERALELLGESSYVREVYRNRVLTRPMFISAAERAQLADDMLALHRLLVSLPDRLYDGDMCAFAEAMRWTDVQIDTVLRRPAREVPPMGRADLYRDESGFRLLELNMGSAMGGLDMADMGRRFLRDPGFAAFAERHRLACVDTLRSVLDTMWASCPELSPGAGLTLAMVDWPSSYESMLGILGGVSGWLAEVGIDAIPCHAYEVESRGGRLYVHGRRIDAVYRWFVIEDVVSAPDAPEAVSRILDAADAGAVALFTPLQAELFGNKSCIALLSDDRGAGVFTAEERALVDRLVPWTRAVRDGKTRGMDDEVVDLVPYLLAHRDDLVLKPTALHGGHGVVCGWETAPAEWEATVAGALAAPYIVQRRVPPVVEEFPVPGGGTEPHIVNLGAFITVDGYGGLYLRGTPDPDVGVISWENGARYGCTFHQLDGC